jgi:hypothetical protein
MDLADQGDADGERSRRHHADRSIRADLSSTGDAADQQRGQDAPRPGAQIEVPVQDVGDGCAAEDRVRKPVADVGHPLQHDIHTHQPTQGPAQQSGLETVTEELM